MIHRCERVCSSVTFSMGTPPSGIAGKNLRCV